MTDGHEKPHRIDVIRTLSQDLAAAERHIRLAEGDGSAYESRIHQFRLSPAENR